MFPQMPKKKLLANEKKKKGFISLLLCRFQQAGIATKQRMQEVLIVNTAILLSLECDFVSVVGEDIDLLILVTLSSRKHVLQEIWTEKNIQCSILKKLFQTQKHHKKHFVYSCFQLLRNTLHSTWPGKIEILQNSSVISILSACIFKDPEVDKQKIIDVTETFFVALYRDDLNVSLDELL